MHTATGQGRSLPLTPAGYNHRSFPFPIPAGSLPSMSAGGSSNNNDLGEQTVRALMLEPTAPPPHNQPCEMVAPPHDQQQSSTLSHSELSYPGFETYNTNLCQQPISMPFLQLQGQIPDDMIDVPVTYEILPLSPGKGIETLDLYGDEPDDLAAKWCMLEPDQGRPSGSGGRDGEMESYPQPGGTLP